MIRFRDHCGGLAESMATAQQFDNEEQVLAHIRKELYPWDVDTSVIDCQFYAHDKRIDWDESWIITIPGFGVVGWTDGAIQ